MVSEKIVNKYNFKYDRRVYIIPSQTLESL